MRLPGILGLAAGLALALALQAVLLAVAHTPLAAPDLLLVLTAALGFAHGPRTGMVCGFLGGLAADLIPPATHAVGREAFVLCLVGYVAGRAAETVRDSVLRSVVLTACLAALSPFVYWAVGTAVGDGEPRPGALVSAAVGSALYAALLAPFVLFVVHLLAGRGETRDIVSVAGRKGLQ